MRVVSTKSSNRISLIIIKRFFAFYLYTYMYFICIYLNIDKFFYNLFSNILLYLPTSSWQYGITKNNVLLHTIVTVAVRTITVFWLLLCTVIVLQYFGYWCYQLFFRNIHMSESFIASSCLSSFWISCILHT